MEGQATVFVTEELQDKMMKVTEEEILKSTLLAYREVYFIYLDGNCYRKIYPKKEGLTEELSYDAIEHYPEYDRVIREDKEDIRNFFSIENIRNGLMTKNVIDCKYRRRLDNGGCEWCLVSFTVGERKGGIPKTATMFVRSIDEVVRKEEEAKGKLAAAVERAQTASLAKSDFLSQMSHDIRTPLNVIIGMSSIAKGSLEDRNRVQDCMEKINTSSRHLLTLINDVLDMSKIESGKIEIKESAFSLQDTIQEVGRMAQGLTAEKQQIWELHMKNITNGCVIGDKSRLIQVLLNLISNAVKYTGEKGKILIVVNELMKRGEMGSHYQFIVKDNGMGMSSDFLDRIFDPYVRSESVKAPKYVGTGLGMSIVKNIVEQMCGTITIKSEEGAGTEVTVCIPFKHQKEQTKSEALLTDNKISVSGRPPFFHGNVNVLLAEDNELNAEIAVDILEDLGVNVTIAKNGKEAYEAVANAKRKTFDCVFMDVQMPVMDGIEASEKIRALGIESGELPIFAMTASVFTDDIARTRAAGMQEHISKPIECSRLLQILLKYFS